MNRIISALVIVTSCCFVCPGSAGAQDLPNFSTPDATTVAKVVSGPSLMGERLLYRRLEQQAEQDAPFHFRLGMMLTPTPRFAGGVDYTFPHPSLFMMRLDAESIVDANIGRSATLYPVTLDVLLHGKPHDEFFLNSSFGAGIGTYIAQQTRFGGKLFMDLGGRSGSTELGVHYFGTRDVLLTLQLRKAF